MIKKVLSIFIITVLVLSLIYFYRFWFSKTVSLKTSESVIPTKALSLNDLYLYAQKTKAMDEITSSEVYFSATKTQLNSRRFQIDFYLSAKDGMKVDGADLVLNVNRNLIIKKVTKGQVFPQYPRLVYTKQQATITGLASLSGNLVKLGQPNRIFTTVVVEKIIPNQSAKISIDQASTKAYLNGEAVLNQIVSLKEINF